MPRDIPVGNGKLLICFDRNYCIRELYFPHVGLENHVGGRFCRMGVWVDGQFAWLGPDWEIELGDPPDTLVTDVTLTHPGLGVARPARRGGFSRGPLSPGNYGDQRRPQPPGNPPVFHPGFGHLRQRTG